MRSLQVLVACEDSQTVCKAFRKLGHEAYSADTQEPSGGHPEWHILGDVLPLIDGNCNFKTMDRKEHAVWYWDLLIAHPPCTYLSYVANRSFSLRCTPAEQVVWRWEQRAKAVAFFMRFIAAECAHVAVENPVGFMTNCYRKPDQYLEPFWFAKKVGDEEYATKKTGLWLRGLPKLVRTNDFPRPNNAEMYGRKPGSGKPLTWEETHHGSVVRSKTFPGIAEAMATQWSKYLTNDILYYSPSEAKRCGL